MRTLTASGIREQRTSSFPAGSLVLSALLLVDLGLFAWALLFGAREVRDGAGSVTTGHNVALAIAGTLVAALAVRWLPLPSTLRVLGQSTMLGGQALHALGHLARLYYLLPWYDDVLHFALAAATALLLLRLAQAWDLFPTSHATPLRAALLTLVLALAVAGGWEIFEFSMDQIQGTREQDDLTDTMVDMMDGLFGGIAAAALAWRFPRPTEATP